MLHSHMLHSLAVGVLLTVLTVVVHGLGTTWWILRLKRHGDAMVAERRTLRPMKVLCSTATVLMLLHVLEVLLWSVVYLMLPDLGEIKDIEAATYFSAVTFASLGYGDLVIAGPWRLLSAFQAMTGLLVFGWSSALFFAVVQRLWGATGVHSDDA